MARIYASGALNTTALVVPNLYVQIVPPATLQNGVSTGRIGIVGTAGWGPVNTPMVVGTMSDYIATFGTKQALTSDAGLTVDIAILQGASDFRVVRVTDGTDTAASAIADIFVGTGNLATLTCKYTGSLGNNNTWSLSLSSKPSTAIFFVKNTSTGVSESFTIPTTGTSISTDNFVAAINGTDGVNTPSNIFIASPASTASSVDVSTTRTGACLGGTDGGVPADTDFIGVDGTPRTGMYALRGQGCAISLLHSLSINTSWTTQASFGLGEGVYMIACGPSGETISNAVATKSSAGLDSYAVKVMFGDWLWWQDDTNGLMLVPPQAFVAGRLAALTPAQSSLNKQMYGIVGSQKSGLVSSGGALTYSDAELEALFDAGIDVICNPAPGGSYWAARSGHNSSSVATTNGDNYTRMTNYLAETFVTGMGTYVGELINSTLFTNIRSTMLAYLGGLLSQGILGSTDGSTPYAVVCDTTNNPAARTALGYVQCDVQVQYQGINEKFIVNLQGGSSVTVSTASGSV